MKALVTGGSGFIGSTLIDALTRRGISVAVLMRKTSSDRNLPVLRLASVIGSWYGNLVGKSAMINRDKLNDILPDYWTCSSTKLMTKTAWRPQILLDEGMREAIGWYRKNGWIG